MKTADLISIVVCAMGGAACGKLAANFFMAERYGYALLAVGGILALAVVVEATMRGMRGESDF